MTESTHTLIDLYKTLGVVTDDELRALFHGVDDAYPISLGTKVATERIAKDAPHILGAALVFLEGATDTQQSWLVGVTHDTLRLAVGAVRSAASRQQSRKESIKTSGDTKTEQTAVTEQPLREAIGWKNVMHGVLENIALGSEPYASRIAAAWSKSEVPSEVRTSLDALLAVGEPLLTDQSPGIVARRKTTRLNKAWLEQGAAVSAALAVASESEGAVRTQPKVTQADVDLHDGWALLLIDQVLKAFEEGHNADATIPRLPLYSHPTDRA